MVELNILARNIDTHLGQDHEECRHFYALVNVLSQLIGDKPMPQKAISRT